MGGGSLENRATLPQLRHCRIVCMPILCESPRPLRPGGHQNKERPPLMGRPLLCGRRRSERPGTINEGGVELNQVFGCADVAVFWKQEKSRQANFDVL